MTSNTLTLISGETLSESFFNALVMGLTEYEFDNVEFICTQDAAAYTPERGVVLGNPDKITIKPDQAFYAPTQREILFTAGGFTKFKYAVEMYAYGTPIEPEWPYLEVEHPGDVPLFTNHEIVVDIEVSGNPQEDEPEDCTLLAISLCTELHGQLTIWTFGLDALADPEIRRRLARLLLNNRLTGHNLKFDLRWVNTLLAEELGGVLLYPADDTMLMHHSLFHGAGEHGLKPLCHRIFNAPDWEGDIKQYTKNRKGQYQLIPQDVLQRYNSQDVYWTWRLAEFLRVLLMADAKAMAVYRIELATAKMYQDIEDYGVWVDLDYAKRIEHEFETEQAESEARLADLTSTPKFNPRSPVQVKKYLEAALAHVIPTTDKKFLARLLMRDQETSFVMELLHARKISKLLGSYIKPPLKRLRRDRVHPVFFVHGTSTGRTSCKNPALQTLPNEDDRYASIRRLYGAPPKRRIVGVDFSQAELRVMAELSGDEVMMADLAKDAIDFFDNLLPTVFPDVNFAALDKAARKPYRLRLKRIVYGLSYGRQAAAIAMQLTVEDGAPTSVEEAQTIIDNYLARYQGLAAWRAGIMDMVIEDELMSPFGRRFQQDIVTEINYVPVENAALAFLPQSTANDICLEAARNLHEFFKAMNWDAHIVLTVHDAIYTECAEEIADLVQFETEQAMMIAAERTFSRVPFLVEGHIGQYLSEV